MTLPFDTEQFFAVFATYNAAIWPSQLVGYGLGIGAVCALLLRHPFRERMALAILPVLWAWNGFAYQLIYFTEINPAAVAFGGIFILQAAIFAIRAVFVHDLRFVVSANWRAVIGLCLIVYAILVYEVLGAFAGHGLMKGPLFGVAPCPTTIFTIGLLLMGSGRSVRWLSVLPITWALIGTSAAVTLNVPEDLGLGIAGTALLLAITLDWFNNARVTEVAAENHRSED